MGKRASGTKSMQRNQTQHGMTSVGYPGRYNSVLREQTDTGSEQHQPRWKFEKEMLGDVLGQTKRFLRGCENFLPALA